MNWIDILLIVLFILVVFVCYLRGFFKTILTFLKIIGALLSAYFLQGLLGPLLGKILPIEYSDSWSVFMSFLPPETVDAFKHETATVVGTFLAFIIIFIVAYLILSIIGSAINKRIKHHTLSRLINRIGGLLIGLVLGVIIVFAASFMIGLLLLIYNPTVAISTIYQSFFLKLFVADSITVILDTVVKQVIK